MAFEKKKEENLNNIKIKPKNFNTNQINQLILFLEGVTVEMWYFYTSHIYYTVLGNLQVWCEKKLSFQLDRSTLNFYPLKKTKMKLLNQRLFQSLHFWKIIVGRLSTFFCFFQKISITPGIEPQFLTGSEKFENSKTNI